MSRPLLLLMGLLCVSAQLSAAQSRPPNQSPVSPHPMTIAETLSLRKPSDVQIGPHGGQVAYVVTQPILETNQDHAVLYVSDAMQAGPGRVLAGGIGITTVRWTPDGRWIFFVLEDENGKEIWRVSPDGGKAERVTNTHGELVYSPAYRGEGIAYQLSPDGNSLVYAVYDSAQVVSDYKARVEGGVVYRGDKWYQQLINF